MVECFTVCESGQKFAILKLLAVCAYNCHYEGFVFEISEFCVYGENTTLVLLWVKLRQPYLITDKHTKCL